MTRQSDLMVDLRKLAIVGTYDLPELADKHADASAAVAATVGIDANLFRLPGFATTSSIGVHWAAIRDTLHRLTADSSVRITNAGAAVVDIAFAYAETDEAGAAGLRETLTEYEETVPFLTTPDDVSDPVHPNESTQPGVIPYPTAPEGDGTGGADYPPEVNP